MKRLVIITVGKTHCGNSTFVKCLEKELDNSFVMVKIAMQSFKYLLLKVATHIWT